MNVSWKTLDNTEPKSNHGFNSPYVSCIVYSCNPSVKIGGVIVTCRWDVNNKQWFKSDIDGNWLLSNPFRITHFIDDIDGPYDQLGCDSKEWPKEITSIHNE